MSNIEYGPWKAVGTEEGFFVQRVGFARTGESLRKANGNWRVFRTVNGAQKMADKMNREEEA